MTIIEVPNPRQKRSWGYAVSTDTPVRPDYVGTLRNVVTEGKQAEERLKGSNVSMEVIGTLFFKGKRVIRFGHLDNQGERVWDTNILVWIYHIYRYEYHNYILEIESEKPCV